ncbi:heavy-metal-associated domain-containing protein [Maribellus maritimus]|uniref:heavy-metal-associated domain-containing protein n=1 Tax=Maribellus maritimus TaxID=2870838 RepID=UPI001EEBB519|nr:cation transporter [Maribellus maritimus]MCG6191324.1 cation transporter [Maribellus maritimus]
MKTKVIVFIGSFLTVFAENKTETFIVKGGNCDECKIHIEKAALSVPGVSIVDWDRESKDLQVVFDDTKTDVDTIQKAIAKRGNDTPNHKANEEAYNELPPCCKYE